MRRSATTDTMTRGRTHRAGFVIRLIMAAIMFLVAIVGYWFSTETNPITGEKQRVAFTADEEVQIGLQSRDELAAQLGGILPADHPLEQQVDHIGGRLVDQLNAWLSERDLENPYTFEFHVAGDPDIVNALALPGGQIFITRALAEQLQRDDQFAAVLAHEMGHVIHRHASERMAKVLLHSRSAAALETATDAESRSVIAAVLSEMLNRRYGRQQELASDAYAIGLMTDAGYDPRAMLELLDILEQADAGGLPEFLSTHPHPESRREAIRELIAADG